MRRTRNRRASQPGGQALTEEETRRLLRLKSDTRYSLLELFDAIEEAIGLGLAPVAVLNRASQGEGLWKTHCHGKGGPEESIRAAAGLIRSFGEPSTAERAQEAMLRGEFPGIPMANVLNSPSFQLEFEFLMTWHRIGSGSNANDRLVKALLGEIADSIAPKRDGKPGGGYTDLVQGARFYREYGLLQDSIRWGDPIVPAHLRDTLRIYSALSVRHDKPPILTYVWPGNPPDPTRDLARHLAENRLRRFPLTVADQAALWFLERERFRDGKDVPTSYDEDFDEAQRTVEKWHGRRRRLSKKLPQRREPMTKPA